jgi:large subunit ribosomal protein L15
LVAANIVPAVTKRVKVIASGAISKKVVLKGIAVTKGAKIAIEAAGGKIEE